MAALVTSAVAAAAATVSVQGTNVKTAVHFGQRTLIGFVGTLSSGKKYFAAHPWH
jgi:hypothetical protein